MKKYPVFEKKIVRTGKPRGTNGLSVVWYALPRKRLPFFQALPRSALQSGTWFWAQCVASFTSRKPATMLVSPLSRFILVNSIR